MDVRSAVRCVVLAWTAGASAQQAVQWRVQDGGNGHWYGHTAEVLVWPQLRDACSEKGGHLVTLTTQAEWQWVKGQLGVPYYEGRFTGGFQDTEDPQYSEPNGGWKWVTGEPFLIDLAYMGSTTPFGPMTGPGFDDCPAGTIGYCGCGPAGAQNILWFIGCCNNILDDIGDGIIQNCDSEPRRGIIEWSADCNGDGIVDYGQIRAGALPDYDGDHVPDCCEEGVPCEVGSFPVQWRVEEGGNGHWYEPRIVAAGLSWSTARSMAEAAHGLLACAESEAERTWFFARFSPHLRPSLWIPQNDRQTFTFGPWLGGRQDPGAAEPLGGWRWLTGGNFNPAEMACCNDFCFGLPENCLHLYYYEEYSATTWNDLADDAGSCTRAPISYLVEWSADCDSDGVVDYGQILRGEVNDVNENGVPDTCDCPSDINQDGTIDAKDLAAVLFAWGATGAKLGPADVTRDGVIDGSDLSVVLATWGMCP